MSIRIDTRKVVMRDALSDLPSRFESLLYYKLMGIPLLHYQLWKVSREEGVAPFLITESAGNQLKQLVISRFEAQWESVSSKKTPHGDIVIPKKLAQLFL